MAKYITHETKTEYRRTKPFNNDGSVNMPKNKTSFEDRLEIYTREELSQMSPWQITKLQIKAQDNGKIFATQFALEKDEIDCLTDIFGARRIPLTLGHKSSSLHTVYANEINDLYQIGGAYSKVGEIANYNNKRTTTQNKGKENERTATYVKSSKDNIGRVSTIMFDIDFHDAYNITDDDLRSLGNSIIHFAKLAGIDPSYVIITGRGIQIHFVLEKTLFRHVNQRGIIDEKRKNKRKESVKKIDALLNHARNTINRVFETEVFPNITLNENLGNNEIAFDNSITDVSQRFRIPGTLNYASNTFSYILYKSGNKFNLSTLIDEFAEGITYDEYIDRKEEIDAERSFKKIKKSKQGNNGNGLENSRIVSKLRLDEAVKAMIYASTVTDTGFRNNGYLVISYLYQSHLTWGTKKTRNEIPDEDIAKFLLSVDEKLKVPYFKDYNDCLKQVKYFRRTESNYKTLMLTNKAIGDFFIAGQIAHDDGICSYFYEETVEERRNKSREINKNKRIFNKTRTIELLKKGKAKTYIARVLHISRTTVYKLIEEYKKELEKLKERKDNKKEEIKDFFNKVLNSKDNIDRSIKHLVEYMFNFNMNNIKNSNRLSIDTSNIEYIYNIRDG